MNDSLVIVYIKRHILINPDNKVIIYAMLLKYENWSKLETIVNTLRFLILFTSLLKYLPPPLMKNHGFVTNKRYCKMTDLQAYKEISIAK